MVMQGRRQRGGGGGGAEGYRSKGAPKRRGALKLSGYKIAYPRIFILIAVLVLDDMQ